MVAPDRPQEAQSAAAGAEAFPGCGHAVDKGLDGSSAIHCNRSFKKGQIWREGCASFFLGLNLRCL